MKLVALFTLAISLKCYWMLHTTTSIESKKLKNDAQRTVANGAIYDYVGDANSNKSQEEQHILNPIYIGESSNDFTYVTKVKNEAVQKKHLKNNGSIMIDLRADLKPPCNIDWEPTMRRSWLTYLYYMLRNGDLWASLGMLFMTFFVLFLMITSISIDLSYHKSLKRKYDMREVSDHHSVSDVSLI